ncbi:MFS transporter [uncultured Draconibacterium sp.]|uniref:MFS transporter n=1 Tax=uncultured Draconibacterium sp. TaxID=1573823 RepID=UPI0029C0110B|nr:MFS transporter [uncultured Draconibacterium sp.]
MNEQLKIKEKIGYGFGDLASSMFWKIFAMYLTFFYTDVVELSPESVALMFIMVRLWDGLNDPLMGIIADRTNTSKGKYRPYLLWIAIPFGLIGVLAFSVPDFGPSGKLVYAYITYTLMMMVYTAINVPYGSLMAVMTNSPKERTALASFRYIGAYSGGIAMTASAPYILDFFKNAGANDAKSYQYMVIIYAIVAAFFFVMTYLWTKERVKALKEKSSVWNDLKDLGKNTQWYIALGANILMLVFLTFREASIMYYFKYFVQDQTVPLFGEVAWGKLSGAYMTIWLAANMLGAFLAIPISSLLGKKFAFIVSMFLSAVFSVLLYWLNPQEVTLIFVLNVLTGISAGVVLPLILSMYADIADYSEWKTDRRAVGLLFSSSSMSQKLGLMAGGALPLYILATYGFQANAEQTEHSLKGIRLMISIYPGITAAISGALLLLYKLTDNKMVRITKELAEKRAQVEEPEK